MGVSIDNSTCKSIIKAERKRVLLKERNVDDSCPITSKKRRISLSLNKKKKQEKENLEIEDRSRFASPIKTDDLEKAVQGVVPRNTKHSTKWAVNTFVGQRAKWTMLRPDWWNPVCLLRSCSCFVCSTFVHHGGTEEKWRKIPAVYFEKSDEWIK